MTLWQVTHSVSTNHCVPAGAGWATDWEQGRDFSSSHRLHSYWAPWLYCCTVHGRLLHCTMYTIFIYARTPWQGQIAISVSPASYLLNIVFKFTKAEQEKKCFHTRYKSMCWDGILVISGRRGAWLDGYIPSLPEIRQSGTNGPWGQLDVGLASVASCVLDEDWGQVNISTHHQLTGGWGPRS